MFFKKKSPKRLYYPTKSRWYNRPRKRKVVTLKRQKNLFDKAFGKARDIFKRFTWVVVGGLVSIALILFLGFSTYFSITDIKIARESFYVDSGAILAELNHFIGENLIFFSRGDIADTIQGHFPEFSAVDVSKTLPGTLTIHLESHPVIANVRAYYSLPESEQGSLLLDLEETDVNLADSIEEAFALNDLEATPSSSEPVEQKGLFNQVGQILFDQEERLELMTITISDLSQPLEDRQTVISSENMAFILDSIDYVANQFDFKVSGIDYLSVAREVHLKTDNDMSIWLTLEKDHEQQLDKLITIYNEAELDQELIRYIDLRVKEKVIYCPVQSECDQV